jgi:hypothetical protein
MTESRYVLLLNNDVELAEDYLEKLARVLDDDTRLAFATGKLLRATQRTHLDGAGDAMLMAGAAYRLGHRDPDGERFDRAMPVLSGCGAAVLYRRVAFVESGGLDLDFFAYLDDLDLALRVQLLGYSGAYVPSAIGYHIGSATLGSAMHPRVVEYITRNQFYLLRKDYPPAVVLRLLPRIVAYQGLWFLFAVRNGAANAYVRGLLAAFRNWRRMRQKGRKLRAKRRIGNDEFLERLRDSERQIYDWQQAQPAQERSALLKIYFRLFGRP